MVLPSDYPVQDYSLSPITIGGHMLQDTLLSLKTLDKGSTGSTLTFSIPANDPKASLVKEEVVFTFKGKSYRIKNVQTITQGMGKVISVYAERFWYNFMTHQVSVNPRELNQNAEYWINDSMEMWKRDGVPWTAGQVDNDRYLDLSIPPSSSLEQLKAVEEIWGGYLFFDEVEQKVHLLENPGRNRGTPLVYNKDVKSITKTVDTSTLTTRLYVRNADDDWIADVNGGKSYVENFEYTEDIKSDFYRFDAAYSPEAMLIAAQYMVDQLSKPRITYEVSLSGMRDRIHEIDRFEVMDTVFIQDEDYSESVLARVVELEIDYLDLSRSRIILGSHTKNLASPTPGTPLLPSRISEFGTKPAKPMGINGSSEGYFEGLIPKSEITIYWPAVTESDTGKDIRISHYEVKISGGRSTETTELSTTFTGLEPGIPIDVSVCAVSIDGVPSLWSEPVEIIPEAPVVVLEPPTSPNLASSLGTVTVAWDKMLKNGVFPTRYLKHLIVNESLDGSTWYEVGTVTVDTPNINLSRTNQRGNTLHYRFIAEDILGGYSPESDTTSIRVASVLDDTEIGSLDQRIEDAQEDANSALDAVLDVKDQVDKAVTGTSVEYAVSNDPNVTPTSGWSTTSPAWVNGRYIFMRTVVTYGGDTTTTTEPVILTGPSGEQGVSVTDVVRFYRLVSTKPAKPTVLTPSGWSTSEPVWDGVNTSLNLYYTDRVRYSNNQFSWSDVQLSSAFEVAKAAQKTLDGLNARFTQTFEPYRRPNGGGELQNGDEWFKTNSSDQIVSINIYNGSKWVPKQLVADSVIVPSSLGTISLKDGAITAPKITASSQLSAKAAEFMELDVSKLRAGSGSFDSAVAGTLKTTVLEAGSITTEMLQVGVQPPSASATERVPASLRDSVYWNKVKSGEIVIQDRVSSYPTSTWTSNAEGLQARAGTVWIPITGRNPVPESREITVTVKGGDKVVGTPFWIYVYYSTSQEGSYANISRQHTTLVDGSYTSTFIFPEGSYDYHVALHKTHSTNLVTYSSASVVESLGSVDGGKTVSISPSRVEMKNGNESTLLTSEGFTHTNSSGQADVRIGHGIPTGMEIRNPRTGSLAPLANIVYGVDHVRDSSSLAYYTLNSGSKAAISKYSGSFKLTSTSDRYLILVNYEMDARALSMDIQLGYSRLSTGSPTNQSVDKTTHAFMIPIETGGSLGTSFARNNRVSRTDSFYFGGMSVGLPHYFNLMFTPTNFISNTGNSATSGSVGVAINSMTFIPL